MNTSVPCLPSCAVYYNKVEFSHFSWYHLIIQMFKIRHMSLLLSPHPFYLGCHHFFLFVCLWTFTKCNSSGPFSFRIFSILRHQAITTVPPLFFVSRQPCLFELSIFVLCWLKVIYKRLGSFHLPSIGFKLEAQETYHGIRAGPTPWPINPARTVARSSH